VSSSRLNDEDSSYKGDNAGTGLALLLALISTWLIVHGVRGAESLTRIQQRGLLHKGVWLAAPLAAVIVITLAITLVFKRRFQITCVTLVASKYASMNLLMRELHEFKKMISSLSTIHGIALVEYTVNGDHAQLCIKHSASADLSVKLALQLMPALFKSIVVKEVFSSPAHAGFSCKYVVYREVSEALLKLLEVVEHEKTIVIDLKSYTKPVREKLKEKNSLVIDVGHIVTTKDKIKTVLWQLRNSIRSSEEVYSIVLLGIDNKSYMTLPHALRKLIGREKISQCLALLPAA